MKNTPSSHRCGRLPTLLVIVACIALLSGCNTLYWYGQATVGQMDLLLRRDDIDDVLNNPHTSAELAQQLRYIQDARDYASQALLLPDNGSYRCYADLEREAAIWTVIATTAFSLDPKPWCYPLVGCQGYRGYFKESAAHRLARRLEDRGHDAVVLATPAYSTLGWFDDPVLNTMLNSPLPELAGTIFHELAHQQIYLAGETDLNESFATWVERAATEQWLRSRGDDQALQQWRQRQHRRHQYNTLLMAASNDLRRLYTVGNPAQEESPPDLKQLQQRKWQRFEQLEAELLANNFSPPEPLNNAQLAIISTYEEGVQRFAALFQCNNNDWTNFYRAVEQLGQWPRERRQRWLAGNIDTPPEVCHLTRAQHIDKR